MEGAEPDLDDIEDVARGETDQLRDGRLLASGVVRRQRQAASTECDSRDAARDAGVPGAARVWVKTFGCAHNTSDSEYMAGQLQAYGYQLLPDAERQSADLWLVNTCTVKSPSQSAMDTLLAAGRAAGKALLVAGCVPQGDRHAEGLEGLSVLGVTQIDRVVEAVQETLKGNTVQLLQKKALPALDLPKVRRNPHVEILPLSTGCLGACTYCKTVHARGRLGSYSPEALVARAEAAVAQGVTEIWLSSEDTGAYGKDIGTSLQELLAALVAVLPPDGRTMLRLGMANPPFILDQLPGIAAALNHPCVYSTIHIPVQSGSNAVLGAMKREYSIQEFCTCVDELKRLVPNLGVHTDIICGFPGETEEDWAETMALVEKYRFPVVNISQFYSRPGTPAAHMKQTASQVRKQRSRALTVLHESYSPHEGLVGTHQRCWFTETAADGCNLAGKTKGGVQVIVAPQPGLLGASATVHVTSACRWSVSGTVAEIYLRGEVKGPASSSPTHAAPATSAASSCSEAGCQGGDTSCSSAMPPPVAQLPSLPTESHSASKVLQPAFQASEWVEAALWAGVAVGLCGVAASAAVHLWTASRAV
jgi:threonylcarbamoyladenosine tRNA methylthiotransferase CDKAL1